MMPSANVSRETIARLKQYEETLIKWNPKINLVAKSTIGSFWERHIEDSLQLFERIPAATERLVDMGSGGGFPGLVIAISSTETTNPATTTLIESDHRKVAFLRTVLRESETQAKLVTGRIETVEPTAADVLTARALANLSQLLKYSERHLAPNGRCLFLKGKNWREEVRLAQEAWQFRWNAVESKTNPEAVLLEIGEISRV